MDCFSGTEEGSGEGERTSCVWGGWINESFCLSESGAGSEPFGFAGGAGGGSVFGRSGGSTGAACLSQ